MKPLLALAVVVLLLAAACGDSDPATGDSSPIDLDGRSFVSTAAAEGGAPRPVVDGTQIEVRFDGGNLAADAGCNQIGGSFLIDGGGRLVTTDLFSTEMGCDPELMDQDAFVVALLASEPVVSLDGEVLTLTGADAEIRFIASS